MTKANDTVTVDVTEAVNVYLDAARIAASDRASYDATKAKAEAEASPMLTTVAYLLISAAQRVYEIHAAKEWDGSYNKEKHGDKPAYKNKFICEQLGIDAADIPKGFLSRLKTIGTYSGHALEYISTPDKKGNKPNIKSAEHLANMARAAFNAAEAEAKAEAEAAEAEAEAAEAITKAAEAEPVTLESLILDVYELALSDGISLPEIKAAFLAAHKKQTANMKTRQAEAKAERLARDAKALAS
jgi:hypothetical protein